MLQGIYAVKFISNGGDFGVGIAIFDNNKIKGGDASYLYEGEYSLKGQAMRSTIVVSHYEGLAESVVGSLESFTLNVVGQADFQGFTLEGSVADQPEKTMTITGKKVGKDYIQQLQNFF